MTSPYLPGHRPPVPPAPPPPSRAQVWSRRVAGPLRAAWRGWIGPAVLALIFTQFGWTVVKVDGTSMMPTLRHGERVLIPRYESWLARAGRHTYQRGDILVFHAPPRVADHDLFGYRARQYLIKRLVAVGGDRVEMRRGALIVNGVRVDETPITTYWTAQDCLDTDSVIANRAQSDMQGFVPTRTAFTVPTGQLFVMGDNRSERGSEDSRVFGSVPVRDVAGRAAAVLWPLRRTEHLDYNCALAKYVLMEPEQAVTARGPLVAAPRALHAPPAYQPTSR